MEKRGQRFRALDVDVDLEDLVHGFRVHPAPKFKVVPLPDVTNQHAAGKPVLCEAAVRNEAKTGIGQVAQHGQAPRGHPFRTFGCEEDGKVMKPPAVDCFRPDYSCVKVHWFLMLRS